MDKETEKAKIVLVNDLSVSESVITGGYFLMNKKLKAECALIVWHDSKMFQSEPLIVEFSFRYGDKKEKYDREASKLAHDIFLLIQKEMKDWIDEKHQTKTAFLYDSK